MPIAGFTSVIGDVEVNDTILLTVGSREVEGFNNYQGTGFLIEGTAKFLESGEEFEMMKEEFSFINKIMEINVNKISQLI